RKLWSRVLIAGAVIVVAVVAWVGVQLLRPVPPMTLAASVTTMRVLPGVAPRPNWPAGAEAAVGLPGTGLLGTHGGSQPVPIASLAKIMTTYLVLSGHPLPAGGSGPAITVTAADASAYASDQRQGQSVVRVTPGEKLTERQALEAVLIPSGNNIAWMLARWDAGSEGAFVAKMNARARSLELRRTRYTDASGTDPATVSTASDQFRLTLRALQIPAFRQIVAMPQVTLPVAGVAYNVNAGLGHDGIVGVKTGSTSAAGGCLAFAAIRTVAGGQVTIVGVVLGVPATPAQPSELGGVITAAENLLASVGGDLEHAEVISPGAVLGTVSSVWTAGPAAVAAAGVAVTGWPGTPVTVTVTPPPARVRDQPGPARRPGHRHDRQRGQPHHPLRQPGRAGTVGTLAPHPVVTGSGAAARPRARLTGMVPGIPLANGSRNRDPHRSQAVARGPR
ncbi:MAG: D-alanyl-D-alanine carboxypeptidase family protein, partial [Streptosporangiaceae bacterium]